MRYALGELIDLPQLQKLMESLFQATGINHALIDNNSVVHTAVGWQEICTRFHRANPDSCARCQESDRHILAHLHEGPCVGYRCPQGLLDYATPVFVGEEHVANIFTGQLLHEPPDTEFFRRQARQFGFEEAGYLAALAKVPVIPRERMQAVMAFQVQLAEMLAQTGMVRMERLEAQRELEELNRDLTQRVEQRTRDLDDANRQLSREVWRRMEDEAALRQAYAYNRSLIEASLDPLVTIGPDGKITDVNSATEAVTGYPRETLIGQEFADYFSDPALARAGYQQVFREGIVRDYQLEIRHRDGRLTPVLYNATIYRDAAGKVVGVFAAARDVTAQRKAEDALQRLNAELEQRVADRTTELKAANQELEDFSYSVSHDLRTPLRAIAGFSQILSEEYASSLDAEGLRLLGVIRDNTAQMGALIDNILEFIQLGRREMECSQIDMGALAAELTAEAGAGRGTRHLRFRLGQLPPARGDRVMIRKLLGHLLANAVKFTRERAEAVIELGGGVEGPEIHYFVKDNGVGFDMRYADKLFKVFERVHPKGQYEGTGTGLAMVKRIAGRHGGRVWAEGRVDAGATIHFTLPRKDPT